MANKSLQMFLNERIKKKIVFLNEISAESFESVGLHLLSMPQEWGGGPDAFSIAEG